MSIILPQTIAFDHAPNAASNDAMSVRVNATQTAGIWTPTSGPSKAAFALVPTANQALTIQATFAVNLFLPLPVASVMLRTRSILGASTVLGTVGPTSVAVPKGSSTVMTPPISMPLVNVDIANSGIGRYDVSWMWQMQLHPGDLWLDIGPSDHTIYVTLDLPSTPWGQATDLPHQVLWPWTDVLDFACEWASGVKVTSTVEDAAARAAKKVEQALFALGDRPDVPLSYGVPRYVSLDGVRFALTKFLKTVSGVPPAGKAAEVDCADCSAALLTFANALGCGLRRHRVQQRSSIGGIGFDTNPIRVIGASGPHAEFFSNHDVTIRPAATPDAHHVFDSCLMVDFDANPASSTKAKYNLARGAVRGDLTGAKSLNWIRRLVKQSDWPNCEAVDLNIPCLDSCVDAQQPAAPILLMWQQYRHEIDRHAPPSGPALLIDIAHQVPLIPDFDVYERVDNPIDLGTAASLIRQSVEYFYVHRGKGDRRIALSLVGAFSVAGARDTLAWLMTASNQPAEAIVATDRMAGDVSFGDSTTRTGYFARGTSVARVRSVGRTPVAATLLLKGIDDSLLRLPAARLKDSPTAT